LPETKNVLTLNLSPPRSTTRPDRKVNTIVHRVPEFPCCRMIWGHPPLSPASELRRAINKGSRINRGGNRFARDRGWGDPTHTTAQKLLYHTPFTSPIHNFTYLCSHLIKPLYSISSAVELDLFNICITYNTNRSYFWQKR
jgi:hypothetical protein